MNPFCLPCCSAIIIINTYEKDCLLHEGEEKYAHNSERAHTHTLCLWNNIKTKIKSRKKLKKKRIHISGKREKWQK